MKDASNIARKNSNLAWRKIKDTTIIIITDEQSSDVNKINFLNETATTIWPLINGKNSVGDIVEKVYKEYRLTRKEAEKEVTGFLNRLKNKRLITIVE